MKTISNVYVLFIFNLNLILVIFLNLNDGGEQTNISITIEFHLLNDALVAHVIPHPMVSTLY